MNSEDLHFASFLSSNLFSNNLDVRNITQQSKVALDLGRIPRKIVHGEAQQRRRHRSLSFRPFGKALLLFSVDNIQLRRTVDYAPEELKTKRMWPIVVTTALVVQSSLLLTSTVMVHSVQNNVQPAKPQAFSSGIKKLPDIYWNTSNPMYDFCYF